MAALNRPVTATYTINETVRVDTQGKFELLDFVTTVIKSNSYMSLCSDYIVLEFVRQ